MTMTGNEDPVSLGIARGLARFRQRIADSLRIADQKARNEAERRAVFGSVQPGGGSLVVFSQPPAPQREEKLDDDERRRLIGFAGPLGRDLLAREAKLEKAGLSPRPTNNTARFNAVDPGNQEKLGRDELDHLLSMSDLGRALLRERRNRAMRAAGIPAY